MKKIIIKKIFLYCTILSLHCFIDVIGEVNQAVTYFWGGGRFGDKIISYATAKWISYKFNMPLLLKPFKYSSMLRLGKEEKQYSLELAEQFEKGLEPVESEQDIIAYANENVIFESRGGHFDINGSTGIEEIITYMFKDQYFMAELQYMLQPVTPLPKIKLPLDKITVAVHIRKGGGYDEPLSSIQYYRSNIINKKFYADERWPQKFPPEQYYADQIKRVSSLLGDKPLFVFLFTDDRYPTRLVNRIKKAVNKKNITFSCRNRGNAHNAHVVEDFYNIARFDCFIRSSSSFAVAAQLLGNHKIIIYPKHFKWIGRKLIVDEVTIVDNRVE